MAARFLPGDSGSVAFVSTLDAGRAKQFYGETRGLPLVAEDGFALMLGASGTPLRVSIVGEMTQAPYTVLGWQVRDIAASAGELRDAGVVFERYAGLFQDSDGIWTAIGGAKVTWFKDPMEMC